jgi:hypothetical protein
VLTLTELHFPLKSCGMTSLPVASWHAAERHASAANTAMVKTGFIGAYMWEEQEE